jgi:hypothetical protein
MVTSLREPCAGSSHALTRFAPARGPPAINALSTCPTAGGGYIDASLASVRLTSALTPPLPPLTPTMPLQLPRTCAHSACERTTRHSWASQWPAATAPTRCGPRFLSIALFSLPQSSKFFHSLYHINF